MTDDETRDDAAPEVEDQPGVDVEAPVATDKADTPEKPDYFSDTFDPATLPDELRPAYNQLRADYTQKTQTVAEQRREVEQHQQLLSALSSDDPNVRAQALEYLGFAVAEEGDEEEEGDEYQDPIDALRAEIQEMKEWRESQAQSAEESQFEQAINADLDAQWAALQKDTGREFDQEAMDAVEAQAFARIDPQTGRPDIRAAYEFLYSQVLGKERQRWVKSKTGAHQPGSGQSGSPAVDMSNKQERIAALARDIQAGMDADAGL